MITQITQVQNHSLNSNGNMTLKTSARSSSVRYGAAASGETLIRQELNRYKPSVWSFIRIANLIGYPNLMSYIGKTYVWPSKVLHQDQFSEISVLAVMLIIIFLGQNLLYVPLYLYKIPFFDQYRVDDKLWHWESDPKGWNKMLFETIILLGFNLSAVASLVVYATKKLDLEFPYRLDEGTLPTGGEIMWQITFSMVLEDFFFHHIHQLLHTKSMYWIHKVHHKYHASIGIASTNAHPIEFVCGNVLPAAVGPLILKRRMHAWTYVAWFAFRIGAAVENHSGYEFPWSLFQAIPFKTPTEYHDFHHSKNQANYSGVLRIWDSIYGTNQYYFEWVRSGRPLVNKYKKKEL